ncbi:MAG: protein kinase domain-containing protein, partial [Planctomyces sp.]
MYQAHQRQLYHRDLKPANILIDRSDRAWVCDFGLVRRGSVQASISPTNSNAFMGTVQFMSPEQERDPRLADVRSDIWSLGATLHYLVTGRSAKGMRAERIPAELREVILQATEEEAADRFADMQVFQQALAAVLAPAASAAV